MSERYPRLREEAYIGSCRLRNRIVKTGASTWYWHRGETHMNARMLNFYGAIAKGGVGLLIVEAPTVDYPYGERWSRPCIDDPGCVPYLKELSDEIHKYGCPTFMQMIHEGPWQNPLFPWQPPTYDGPPIGASDTKLDIRTDMHRDAPRPLKAEEIHELTEKFAAAACNCKMAGYDGIDINCASSHLFHNFLSPFWNRRTDEYGGSVENRTRFICETIRAIKARCGKDFPVMICINGLEMGAAVDIANSTCMTFEDCRQSCLYIQEAGADAIHVRSHWLGYHQGGYLPDKFFYPEPPCTDFPKEYYAKERGVGANRILSEELKKVLHIPVMVVGKVDADLGEKLIEEGKADLIGMNRPMFADPAYPSKVLGGRESEIQPCTACLTCLDPRRTVRRCRINAFMGREIPYEVPEAQEKKRVVVVGGGPGGMQAARMCAMRGHTVILMEKRGELGGLMPSANFIKGYGFEPIGRLVAFFKNEMVRCHVDVRLHTEATPERILAEKPDAVVLATGGILGKSTEKGVAESRIVMDNNLLHAMLKFGLKIFPGEFLEKCSKICMPVGKDIIVLGGGSHGLELAEFFVRRNKNVTILERGEVLGGEIVPALVNMLMGWFERKGVKIYKGLQDIEITDTGANIVTKEGEKLTIRADRVAVGIASVPDHRLYGALQGRVSQVIEVGDCNNPQFMVDAIASGLDAALAI